MARYLLKLAYDGTNYHGWQIQPNAITVQGELQAFMKGVFQRHVETTGCGRTDAGVHASMFFAHFDLEENMAPNLIRRANAVLPQDIRLQELYIVPPDFNARFDAISRSYEYNIHFAPDPFLSKYSLLLYRKPDFDAMNSAASHLLQHDTFTSFSRIGGDNKTDFCKVTEALWKPYSNDTWRFHITANRFLRGMVRAIVGTLLLVGQKKITEQDFIDIMLSHDRTKAGESIDAKALFLCDIKYPSEQNFQSLISNQ